MEAQTLEDLKARLLRRLICFQNRRITYLGFIKRVKSIHLTSVLGIRLVLCIGFARIATLYFHFVLLEVIFLSIFGLGKRRSLLHFLISHHEVVVHSWLYRTTTTTASPFTSLSRNHTCVAGHHGLSDLGEGVGVAFLETLQSLKLKTGYVW